MKADGARTRENRDSQRIRSCAISSATIANYADECKFFNVVVICYVVTDGSVVTFVDEFTDGSVGRAK
jgi:hypothetical protein